MELKDFKLKQRVCTRDEEEGKWVRGTVLEIKESSVLIDWDDLLEPINHPLEELQDIKPT